MRPVALRKLYSAISHPGRTYYMALQAMHRACGRDMLPCRLRDYDVTMYLDNRDPGLSLDMYRYGAREPYVTRKIVSMLRPGQTIIDIGANLGYYALIEAAHILPGGKVYAIEPSPRNVEVLSKSTVINGWQDCIDITQAAIGDKSQGAVLNLSRASNLHRVASPDQVFNHAPAAGRCEIEMLSLDDFIQRKGIDLKSIDIIRMDIEGYEPEAFLGMAGLLAAGLPLQICVEVHRDLIRQRLGEQGYDRFWDLMQTSGLRVTGMSSESGRQWDSQWDELRGQSGNIHLFLER